MNRFTLKLLAAALLLTGAQQAFAQTHTGAGVKVGNTANVEYKVGAISQTTVSGTADFVVDRLVNLAVTTTDSAEVTVVPNTNHVADSTANSKVLRYQINNQTNAAIGVNLVAANAADATVNPFGAAPTFPVDSFDVGTAHPGGTFRIYLDAGVANTFEPGVADGSAITQIASIAAGTSVYVWVVADIPAAGGDPLHPVNDDVAVVSLKATAVEPTTYTAITYLTTTDNNVDQAEGSFDSVAGDTVAGVVDGVKDGADSAYSAYKVSSAKITVTKTSFVMSDPVNLTVKPKAIPGAHVLYCIEVANGGAQPATDITINDNIPVGTTYSAGTIRVVAPNTDASLVCNATTAGLGVAQADGTAYVTTPDKKVTTTVTPLAAGEKTTTVFQVTID